MVSDTRVSMTANEIIVVKALTKERAKKLVTRPCGLMQTCSRWPVRAISRRPWVNIPTMPNANMPMTNPRIQFMVVFNY